jgi:hypothetical protein
LRINQKKQQQQQQHPETTLPTKWRELQVPSKVLSEASLTLIEEVCLID